jgi:hypothetical protein
MRKQIAIRENDDSIIQVDYDETQGVSGKYWVIQKNKTGWGKHIILSRIFDTETAWSDAERHANDLLKNCGFNYTHTINL